MFIQLNKSRSISTLVKGLVTACLSSSALAQLNLPGDPTQALQFEIGCATLKVESTDDNKGRARLYETTSTDKSFYKRQFYRQGTVLKIAAIVGEFVRVNYEGGRGYIHKSNFSDTSFTNAIQSCANEASRNDFNNKCKQAQNALRDCEASFYLKGATDINTFCKSEITTYHQYCGDGAPDIGTTRDHHPGVSRPRASEGIRRPARRLGKEASACSNLPNCSGHSHIEVDIASNCMCVGNTCFKVGVGEDPGWNPTGSGVVQKIVRPDGVGRYQTNPLTNISSFDDDAVAMSLPGVWDTGKWIHKSGNCSSYWHTKGCIAVPCSMWDLVKNSIGNTITVCRQGGGRSIDADAPSSRAESVQ